MELRYAYKPGGRAVKAMGRDMNVSFKDLVMISDAVRGRGLLKAIELLESVVALKRPIPYRRYRKGIGHRRGSVVKVGKYPRKAGRHVLDVLRNLTANAEYKGLDAEKLKLTHVEAQKGVSRPRRKPKGRWAVWSTQYCHLQVVAEEK